MHLDGNHAAVSLLQKLVPSARIGGGCFSAFLPHPGEIAPSQRAEKFKQAKETATRECISRLLADVGLRGSSTLVTGVGGERRWPSGYVGSLTYKATIVLGAIAEVDLYSALGIDLEMIDGHEQELQQNEIAPEGLPSGMAPDLGTLVTFSAKEAVFKAQFPASQQVLDFSQIRLTWDSIQTHPLSASAVVPDGRTFEVSALISPPWTVCAAIKRD